VLAQMAAEVLGIEIDKVNVTLSDTEVTPYDHGNIATRGTYFTGNAVLLAAEDAKRQLFETVAREFEVSADDLEAKNGRVMVKGKPEQSVTIADVSYAHHYYQGGPILGRGSYFVLIPRFDPEKTFGKLPPVPGKGPPTTYAVQAVELEVDPETGVVTPLKWAAAHGVGKAIHPKAVEGQIEGGVAMGIGYGLHEVIEFDSGKVINPSFVDYRLPTTKDVPEIECLIVEEPLPTGPYGAKGVGEVCQVATAAAIANAIYDAIGVRIKEQPITPERILKALEEKRGKQV